MKGKFAVFLAPDAPRDLMQWTVTDDGPPYLRCTELEDAPAGLVRIRVVGEANGQRPAAALLVHRHHIAWVLDGHQAPQPGFV